jgi:ParB-like chromosome segregation protein Spo0J
MTQEWSADKITRRKVDDLIPYARNARTHSDEQVAQIAASIKEWGWTTPVLIDESGEIIAGHGRVMAARKLGIEEVPTMTATGWTKAQKRAYVLADNQLPQNAGWDMDLLKVEFMDLDGEGFDLKLMGFDDDFMANIFLGDNQEPSRAGLLSEN